MFILSSYLKHVSPLLCMISLIVLMAKVPIAKAHKKPQLLTNKPLVIWHAYRGQERTQLEESIHQYVHDTGQAVKVLHLPYQAFANKIQVAIPRGNGPDLFIFAHDRVGDWAESGLIEPLSFWIDSQEYQRYFPSAIQALTYHQHIYALPLSCKTLALFYHKKWVSEVPNSIEELVQQVQKLKEKHPKIWGLAYPEVDSLYFHAPWLHAWGGHVLRGSRQEIDLDLQSTTKSMQMIADLRKNKVMPPELNGALVSELFRSGQLAFVINGPWFKGDLSSDKERSENNHNSHQWWGVAPLPIIEATQQRLKPFLSVEAIMMSAYTVNKSKAWHLLRYLSSDQVATHRLAQGQIVAQKKAYQSSFAQNDPWIQTFNQQLNWTVPLSNLPIMKQIWTPMKRALSQVILYQGSADTAMQEVYTALGKPAHTKTPQSSSSHSLE